MVALSQKWEGAHSSGHQYHNVKTSSEKATSNNFFAFKASIIIYYLLVIIIYYIVALSFLPKKSEPIYI